MRCPHVARAKLWSQGPPHIAECRILSVLQGSQPRLPSIKGTVTIKSILRDLIHRGRLFLIISSLGLIEDRRRPNLPTFHFLEGLYDQHFLNEHCLDSKQRVGMYEKILFSEASMEHSS